MREAANGWAAVSEGILRGLAHEMNNRLLALMGVRELAEDGLDSGLATLFSDEIERLESAVRLLRRLVESPDPEEPTMVAPLLDSVRELHARNALARGVPTEWSVAEGLRAVRTRPVLAERALLQALSAAASTAREAGGGVEVSVAQGPDGVVVGIRPGSPDGVVEAALQAAGADASGDRDGLRVLFPSL